MERAATLNRTSTAFVVKALLWSLALLAVTRLVWVEQSLILPLTELQGSIAQWLGGRAAQPVAVGLSCSGTDVMAVCLGAILAYPASGRRRLGGVLGVLGLILVLNTARIGSLSHAAASPRLFQWLHLFVWPALLLLAAAGWVFRWMGQASTPDARSSEPSGLRFSRRLVLLTVGSVFAFAALSPWCLRSPALLRLAGWMAAAAAAVMNALGVEAEVSGNLLRTGETAFVVTQECIATPLLAVAVAVVLSLRTSWPRRLLGLTLVLPLFVGLGTLRLLVLALPRALVDSPLFLVHAFYQLLLGGVLVLVAAAWRGAWRHAPAALAAGALTAILVSRLLPVDPATDPQAVLTLLPPFQLGLFVALWLVWVGLAAWGRFATGLALLVISQLALLALVDGLVRHQGFEPSVPALRAWSLLAPVALALLLRRRPAASDETAYRHSWEEVAADFPDLGGAASTRFYFENERRLLTDHLGDLDGTLLLKTDLWDEVKNTRIGQWAADQGARVAGVDIAAPMVECARGGMGGALLASVADVRRLPFRDQSFDAVYSMGTIEHFAEPEAALGEIVRVLKPGGRVILGVPNRRDPFLRPLLVAALQALGLYAYGYELSFSRPALRRMLEAAGLEVVAEDGILFIPGWLRMLDLACWVWLRPLSWLTAAAVWPWAVLHRRAPGLGRYGYLIASVGVKPSGLPDSP